MSYLWPAILPASHPIHRSTETTFFYGHGSFEMNQDKDLFFPASFSFHLIRVEVGSFTELSICSCWSSGLQFSNWSLDDSLQNHVLVWRITKFVSAQPNSSLLSRPSLTFSVCQHREGGKGDIITNMRELIYGSEL